MKSLTKYFVLLAVLFLASACSSLTQNLLKDPEVSIVDFILTGISAEEVSMNLNLNVKNPNPVPLNVDAISYALNLSGERVTEGTFDKGINVPAAGENKIAVPLKFKFNSVKSIISGFLNKTLTKDYELTGSAKLGFFSIPFSKKGEISLGK